MDGGVRKFIEDPKKKILTMDGGGIRGAITLGVLIYLEEQSNKKTSEIFDMVSGTSIGAILSAGFAMGYSAKWLYENVVMDILSPFFSQPTWKSIWNLLWHGHAYHTDGLVQQILTLGDDLKIGEIKHLDVLFTAKDTRTGTMYYITNVGKGAEKFSDWTLSQAAEASAAAPLYFPPAGGNFVDGGVGVAGNPCFVTAKEAMIYNPEYTEHNTILVSIGTGHQSEIKYNKWASEWSWMDAIGYTVSELINDGSVSAIQDVQLMFPGMDFRRYNPSFLPEKMIELDYMDTTGELTRLRMDNGDPVHIEWLKDLGYIYAKNLDWGRSNILPWHTLGGRPKPSVNADW